MAANDGLPIHVNPARLVRDATRAGHWIYPPTEEVFSMGPDWLPLGDAVGSSAAIVAGKSTAGKRLTRAELGAMTKVVMFDAAAVAGLSDYEGMTKPQLTEAILAYQDANPEKYQDDPYAKMGKRVEVTWGRFEGRRGQVSDVNDSGNVAAVILDGGGQNVPIDDEPNQVRFLTEEEIAADEAALKAQQEAASANPPGPVTVP